MWKLVRSTVAICFTLAHIILPLKLRSGWESSRCQTLADQGPGAAQTSVNFPPPGPAALSSQPPIRRASAERHTDGYAALASFSIVLLDIAGTQLSVKASPASHAGKQRLAGGVAAGEASWPQINWAHAVNALELLRAPFHRFCIPAVS